MESSDAVHSNVAEVALWGLTREGQDLRVFFIVFKSVTIPQVVRWNRHSLNSQFHTFPFESDGGCARCFEIVQLDGVPSLAQFLGDLGNSPLLSPSYQKVTRRPL